MGIQLIDATGYVGQDKLQELVNYLLKTFRTSVEARTRQVDTNYTNWINNYNARPMEEKRTSPWVNASNFIPQVCRMHTDILMARMVGTIFGTKPFWKPTAIFGMMPHKAMEVLGSWLEFETFHRTTSLQPALISSIYRTFKTGTCIQKNVWKDVISTEFGVGTGVGESGVQIQKLNQEGFCLENVPFEDFYVYPLTVETLEKVEVKFHRLRFSEHSVQWRKTKGLWNPDATDFMLKTNGDYKPETPMEAKAQEAGITLTKDTVLPFTAIEAWITYPVGDTRVRLIATFNPNIGEKSDKALLRLIFNPDPLGEDPYNDLRFADREDFFYGYSIPEILEQSQEEAAQIHNARRDNNTIANTPTFKRRRLADVPNPASEWYPGKIFDLDDMADLDVLAFGGNYNSMIDEESFLQQLDSAYTGISAAQQSMGGGILDGKRGIYNAQGTMAMLQEGNDRPNLYLRKFRHSFHKLGRQIFRYNKNYRQTPIPFQLWGENGAMLQQLFMAPDPPDYHPVFFAVGASDGSANREVDRTNLLLMSNTMAGYYNQVFQAVSTVAAMPSGEPMREVLLQILDGAKDLADRLLYVFDIGDRNRLIPDVRSILGEEGQPQNAGIPSFDTGGEGSDAEAAQPVSVGALQELSRSIGSLPRGSSPSVSNGGGSY